MATEKVVISATAPASADLSAKQFFLVKLNASAQLALAGAGDNGFPLQDKPKLNQTGTYAIGGIAKVIAGGTVAPGAYVSADAAGKAVTATATAGATTGTHIVGQALDAAVAGDIFRIRVGTGLA